MRLDTKVCPLPERAPAHGCWVKRAPAVSVLQSGPMSVALTQSLVEAHVRVIAFTVEGCDGVASPTLNNLPASVCCAVADSNVTLFEQADAQRASPDPLAIATVIGEQLELKTAYHVVVVLAGEHEAGQTMPMIAAAIEQASGKHLGPDFGLCLVLSLADQAPTVFATDRRAGFSAQTLFEVLGQAVVVKPLFLQQVEPC